MTIEPKDRINLQEFLKLIAEFKADAHPEEWQKDTEDEFDNGLRRAIAAAMNQHGWPGDGIPGALPHLLGMLQAGAVTVRSTYNDFPPTDVSEVRANPANWYLSVDDARHVAGCLGAEGGIRAMHAHHPPDDEANQYGYTIRGAAKALAKKYGIPEDAFRKNLYDAAKSGKLKMSDPRTGLPADFDGRDFHQRIAIEVLNEYFDSVQIPYELDRFEHSDDAAATSSPSRPGVPSKEIQSKFRLTDEWEDRMKHIAKYPYLKPPVLVQKGMRGGPGATWNPAHFGKMLMDKGFKKELAVNTIIERQFPEWLDDWEAINQKGNPI